MAKAQTRGRYKSTGFFQRHPGLAGARKEIRMRLMILRSFLIGLVAGGALVLAQGAESKSDGDWRTLPLIKNGKVDPAWLHVGYGGFVVEGDTLKTDAAPEGLGLLVYKKEKFGKGQIRVVFKAKDERANSGVYVRIADGILKRVGKPGAAFNRDAKGNPSDESMEKVKASAEHEDGAWYPVHNGYEVQIAGGGDPLHRTGAVYSLGPSEAVAKPGEWQTMIITLEGTKISVDLDGKHVSSVDTSSKDLPPRKQWHEPKREPKRPEVGYIGLQNHDPGDVVWFKEISVKKNNP
jgi:hypothetical protein